jgi:hypothetical protein
MHRKVRPDPGAVSEEANIKILLLKIKANPRKAQVEPFSQARNNSATKLSKFIEVTVIYT